MNLVFLASKGILEYFSFHLSYNKPCGKLALGQNSIKVITVKIDPIRIATLRRGLYFLFSSALARRKGMVECKNISRMEKARIGPQNKKTN